jgi:hypothetical protein
MRQAHPVASIAGDAAGQLTAEGLLGRIPGAQSLMAGRWGRRGADALYGAYAGSGENNDNPGTGAVEGALVNTLGGMVGRGVNNAAGRTLAGVKNAHLQYLDNRGIPLTLGQIARGSENTFGHAVGGIEERMAGMPVADAIINTARRAATQVSMTRCSSQIAPGVTATGAEGLAQARAAERPLMPSWLRCASRLIRSSTKALAVEQMRRAARPSRQGRSDRHQRRSLADQQRRDDREGLPDGAPGNPQDALDAQRRRWRQGEGRTRRAGIAGYGLGPAPERAGRTGLATANAIHSGSRLSKAR